jgi:MYXO-CTERM domain-containing protein
MRALAVSLCFAALLHAGSAHAQASLINGLGGTAGYGTQCLGMNDDGSSNSIDITPYFPGGLRFFTGTHTALFVNTNGNITFSGALPTFTPNAFPVADRPMIAPYWADVDTRPACDCGFFGCTCSGPGNGVAVMGPPCDNPTENGVWWHLQAATATAPARAIFTWDRVGYFARHTDQRMNFQLVLTQANDGCGGAGAGTDFEVEFRFNRCEWETGDASGGSEGFGGTEAQSGFDAGNRVDFVEIMGSRNAGIARRLCTESNVGEPGIWRFFVVGGVVMCPDAGMACTVPGAMGVCAVGRTNCVGGGTECVPNVTATAERCDNLDNDCDGMVDDDGDLLCPVGQACRDGTCLDSCFELGCPDGQVCLEDDGRCIDAACETVTCPEGERCEAGSCVNACAGVVCPYPQTCSGGVCTDLCEGLTCDDCTICVEGACVPPCPTTPCGSGESCQADGRCVDMACDGVTCPAGERCTAGSCVSLCEGVVCPDLMVCQSGQCVTVMQIDAGPPPMPDAGMIVLPDAGSAIDAGGADAGRRGGLGAPGCACRASASSRVSIAWLAPLALVLVLRRRRR